MTVAWGSKQSATQLTTVSTEQFFDATPQLAANEQAHCQVITDASGTTDNAIVAVYATLDDSTETWDETPLFEFTVDNNAGSPNEVSFVVPNGVYKFRIGVRRDGSTDTFTADLSYRVATLS